jgi:hypothetical protein
MIKLIAFDPIDYWIILEERNILSLLKPPYSSIHDKVFLSQDRVEEAIGKRGFLPETNTFSNIDDAISFIQDKKKLPNNSDLSDSNESDDFYSFIPERPLIRFINKYEPKVPSLPISQLENLKDITEIILFRNPCVKENQTLKTQFLKLNESCKNQIISMTRVKANKFPDLAQNQEMGGMVSSISQFSSENKRLLRLA